MLATTVRGAARSLGSALLLVCCGGTPLPVSRDVGVARAGTEASAVIAPAPEVESGRTGPAAAAVAAAAPELAWLDVDGYGPAVVSIPPARSRAYPLLVVAHGAGCRPEWHCELWQQLVGRRGFVLCLRGRRLDARVPYETAGSYFPDHHYLGALVEASVAALVATFAVESAGARVDPSAAVFAGYSQGATMGSPVVAAEPSRFVGALLIEGGFRSWNVSRARQYRAGGGRRIAFVCGGSGCAISARETARWVEQGGVEALVTHVEGAGHTSFGPVAERLPEVFQWLVAADPRWELEVP